MREMYNHIPNGRLNGTLRLKYGEKNLQGLRPDGSHTGPRSDNVPCVLTPVRGAPEMLRN